MSSTDFFLIKEEQKEIKFDILSEPKVEDSCSTQDIVTKQEDDDTDHKEEEIEVTFSSREYEKPCLAESEVGEYDEGFKTPTSLVHKIPVVTQCPAAPRKTRPSKKRKSSPARIRRSLQLDVSAEIESLFPSRPRDCNEHKIKKARRDGAE
ncbi:unnamed protein product [Fraxinus pennsylvanica]|uniref:Cyclin-dependent protein kinase inhibitor SMR3 n=1 Tax=Fraxinus pennsylvanica TaxID=56036 RepID=A0AAD2DQ28_9LAMI|nr:unnamed protein product [Fraxinus pennsylvanica]